MELGPKSMSPHSGSGPSDSQFITDLVTLTAAKRTVDVLTAFVATDLGAINTDLAEYNSDLVLYNGGIDTYKAAIADFAALIGTTATNRAYQIRLAIAQKAATNMNQLAILLATDNSSLKASVIQYNTDYTALIAAIAALGVAQAAVNGDLVTAPTVIPYTQEFLVITGPIPVATLNPTPQ